jgi:hypothetical protein
MRDKFFPFFKHSEEELKDIWENGFIVIDANVLLNTYKMDSEARKQFFEVLSFADIPEKLWMPYQVGWEFLKNRKKAIDSTVNSLVDAKREIKKRIEGLKSNIERSGLKFHEDFLIKITDEIKDFQTQMNSLFDGYEDVKKESDYYEKGQLKESDPISDMIFELYKEKTGDRFSQETLLKFFKEGQFRFDLLIPPGFEDVDKGDYRTYGDFIIWEEIKKKAIESKKPIIFVTEDHKEDWWLKDHKNNMKPQQQLLAEFRNETKQYIFMYTYKDFIEEAKKRYETLPETDKVTKQMDLAAEEEQNYDEDQEQTVPQPSVQIPATISDDPYLIHLQNLMNHANPTVANRAHSQYLQRAGVIKKLFNEAMARAHSLSHYNQAKAAETQNTILNIYNRSDLPDSKKLSLFQSILNQIDDDISFYDVQGY